MFPMASWHLTFYSLETIFLIISFCTVYFVHKFKFYPVWFLFIPILFFLDRGNILVLIMYISFYLFFLITLKYFRFKTLLIIAFIG